MQLSLAPVVAFAFGYHPLLFAAILRFFVVTLRFPLSSLAFLVVILREAEDLLFSHHADLSTPVISTGAVRVFANCGAEKPLVYQ